MTPFMAFLVSFDNSEELSIGLLGADIDAGANLIFLVDCDFAGVGMESCSGWYRLGLRGFFIRECMGSCVWLAGPAEFAIGIF